MLGQARCIRGDEIDEVIRCRDQDRFRALMRHFPEQKVECVFTGWADRAGLKVSRGVAALARARNAVDANACPPQFASNV